MARSIVPPEMINRAAYHELQEAGMDAPQAEVVAAHLPDWSQFATRQDLTELRAEMNAKFADLRADMERRLNTQTWTIVGTLVALGALLVATNLWG